MRGRVVSSDVGDSDTDDERFTAFVSAAGGRLLHSAELLVGNRAAAEDLLQTALTRTYLHWRRVEEPEAYVRRVLARLAIDTWRRRRWREVPTAEPASAVGAPVSLDEAEAVTRRHTVLAALATLTPRERAVVVLRYYDDLTEAAVADALGIATGTVKSTASRALTRLRTVGLLADLAPESTR